MFHVPSFRAGRPGIASGGTTHGTLYCALLKAAYADLGRSESDRPPHPLVAEVGPARCHDMVCVHCYGSVVTIHAWLRVCVCVCVCWRWRFVLGRRYALCSASHSPQCMKASAKKVMVLVLVLGTPWECR